MINTTYRLPESLENDLETFRIQTERFQKEEISFAEYRAFRVPQGIYEQREEGTHMLRIRLPAGAILPHQMECLAGVSRRYGDGVLHVTGRQGIQIHGVALDDLHPSLVELFQSGLSTKGGGGNTVRNITACPLAGVCEKEVFDVAPDAISLTERLIDEPDSYRLPRKLKIAFSGCLDDCAGAAINDIGFVARSRDGREGYAVYAGGGMGASSRVGQLLEPFVPAERIHHLAGAIKRVFDRHGNRRNRGKARLRFLIERIGMERFRELYKTERRQMEAETADLRRRPASGAPPPEPRDREPAGPGSSPWRRNSVRRQKQSGYFVISISLPLGNIAADKLEALARIPADRGEGIVRATQSQNLSLHWVSENDLEALHRRLALAGIAGTPAPILQQIVSCPGAATCKLGLCLSRGLARAVSDELTADSLDLEALGDLNIHISGCPNSCGRHPIGNIGLSGAARRVDGRPVPHYTLQLGGRLGEGQTRLAEGRWTVPAKRAPAVVAGLLRAYAASPEFPDFHAFVDCSGREIADKLAAENRDVPSFDTAPEFYSDWGSDAPFSMAGRGAGECGAGVFDLIELDLASAEAAAGKGKHYSATVAAARALLVTRGVEAKNDREALDLFAEHFIAAGLVPAHFTGIVDAARRAAATPVPEQSFEADAEQVNALVQNVGQLYEGLDPSLRFNPGHPAGDSGKSL